MKNHHLLVALIGALSASCSLDLSHKNACLTSADCMRGQTCVNRQCERDQTGRNTDAGDASVGSTDGRPERRDASSDQADATDEPSDSSRQRQDGSVERPDGSSDDQESAPDASQDGGIVRADGSPQRDSGADGRAAEPPVQGTCDAGTVTACPAPAANTRCQQVYCGGRLWRDGPHSAVGYIPYRIRDPNGLFSDAYKSAIRAGAAAWSNATAGTITLVECSSCTGRFISVVPGSGDGVDESPAWEQLLPLPVDSAAPGNIPWHRIAHQWGHAIGLDDMYRRPDRDLYASFDPAVWCGQGASMPATCAPSGPTQQPGSPPIASGTFGAYDEHSVMNGLESEGVCGTPRANPSSGQPTLGDVSAVDELYAGRSGPWTPFQPIARSAGADGARDYQLAPGVDPVGGPAIAEWTTPSVDIVVRGTDGNVYETWNDLLGTMFLDWADWRVVADHVDADPAVVFAGPTTLHLAVRSALDGSIRLRTRTAGVWGAWGSLGAPRVGAASAPAIAALDQQSLTVFVRGGDDLIYQLECTDPGSMCAASAAAVNAWTPLPTPDFGGFLGKPSATWMADGSGIMIVAAVGPDHGGWVIGPSPSGWGEWLPIGVSVSPEDPDPGVAMGSDTTLYDLDYFTADANGLLLHLVDGDPSAFEIGGMPIATPGAVGSTHGDVRVDVVALIDDHGHPGVWWKSRTAQNRPPCNYNAPGTCAQCGCGFTGGPPCDL